MSRWSEAFDAIRGADTVDTVDTVPPPAGCEPQSVNSVNSVMGWREAAEAAERRAEGKRWIAAYMLDLRLQPAEWTLEAFPEHATAADPDDEASPPRTRVPVVDLDDHVEMLAEAMCANRDTMNRDTAMRYLRPIARTRLSATQDQYARGLLIGFERHRVKRQPG